MLRCSSTCVQWIFSGLHCLDLCFLFYEYRLRCGARVKANSFSSLEDQGLLSDDEATLSVDALVAPSAADDSIIQRPLDTYDHTSSRTSTPAIPPGFELLPHAHPANREDPIAKPQIKPTSAPFTPSRSSSFIPRTGTPLAIVSVPPTPVLSQPSTVVETPASQAKKDLKTLATSTGLSKAIASQASHPALQDEDFPALESAKIRAEAPSTPSSRTVSLAKSASTTAKKSSATPSASIPPTQTTSKASEKRVIAPLNIAVPGKSTAKTPAMPETPSKQMMAASAFPPLPPTSTPVPQSPAPKPPKTLRVVATPTPRTETPVGGPFTPSSTTGMFPPHFPPSRQPSLASASRLDRPGTPTSEAISDNVSITSTSISRANSPPPNRIGSAPVRATTKSMQRKVRREIQKEKERSELEATAVKSEPENVIGPIIGRKKKQKKDRNVSSAVHSAAGGSTPTISRPSTPGPSAEAVNEVTSTPKKPEVVEKASPVEPEPEKPSRREQRGKGKARNQRPATPEPPPPTVEEEIEEEPVEKPIPTPAAIFQELINAGVLIDDINNLYLLKNPVKSDKPQEPITDMSLVNPKLVITPEDRATLLAGKTVHKVADGQNRIMLTPNGDCVRNLTPEEEERYLDLQERLAEESGPTAFTSTKHNASNGFVLIQNRAVPNGPPSFFPMWNNSSTMMDPVSKIQRDEALSYINQFVLPSLSTNSQLEKALNANALDTIRSGDATAWASWGTDSPAMIPSSENDNGLSREGSLAMGLESMTQHFSLAGESGRGGAVGMGSTPLGNVNLLSLNESESALQIARKETDGLEKRLNALLKKNRRLLLGSGH